MKFLFHNKIELKYKNKNYLFFNTMLNSVFDKLKNLEAFNKYVSVGSGEPSTNQTEYHLTSYLKTYELETEILQNDISNGNLFIKQSVIIDDANLNDKYIKEIGLSNNEDNPIIYNYFSLISEELPNGIKKENGEAIVFSIYIYLTIIEDSSIMLTSGNNKFINFLLGLGLDDNIYVVKGNNTTPNKRIFREEPTSSEKYLTSLTISESDGLNLNFSADLGSGEINELVFLVGNSPFARVNLQEYKTLTTTTQTYTPKTHYVVDLGENVNSYSSIKNLSTNLEETNVYAGKYANDFGDKITLPFHNIFDSTTPRFLSKDGDKIFFVIEDTIYGYINNEYQITQIKTGNITIQNIFKIISFEDNVFVITKTEPYIYSYKITNNELVLTELDLTNFEKFDSLDKIFNADITLGKNGVFMLGLILEPEHYGYTLYFTYDQENNKFIYDSYLVSEYLFSYILAMYKNNFSDGQMIYLREGEHSVACRIVYHYSDKTLYDVFTNYALTLTKNTKEIYTKNRAIIVEKTTEPYLWIYFYPQIYQYNLSILGSEEDDYISTNLIYLIQKYNNSTYKIYNLVGYVTPTEFTNGFPSEIDKTKILGFEFLKDTLLIFMDNKDEPIVGYNLKETSMLIENVSVNTDQYEIVVNKYDLLGSNNEGVIANLAIKISIWFFQTETIKYLMELMFLFLQTKKMKWFFISLIIQYQKI